MNLNASAESIMMLLARNPPASIRLRFGVCLQFGSFDGGHRAAPGGTGRHRAAKGGGGGGAFLCRQIDGNVDILLSSNYGSRVKYCTQFQSQEKKSKGKKK